VADLVFLECIKRELFYFELIGDDARECARKFGETLGKEDNKTCEEEVAEWFLEYREVHRALGWIRKDRKNKNSGHQDKE